MIKTIFFDWGGTYATGSVTAFVKKACTILGISRRQLEKSDVLFDPDYNKGKIPIEEFFRRYFGAPISEQQMKQIIAAWKSTWNPEPEMVDLVHELEKKYRLGVLSNSDPVNFKMGKEKGWYSHFDVFVLSHELGLAKPEKEIYLAAIQKSGCKAEEILFIDDQKSCLKTAEKLGMKTILFSSLEQLEKDLAEHGIKY